MNLFRTMCSVTPAKLLEELQEGRINEVFVKNVQCHLVLVLSPKGKTSQKSSNLKEYGLLCMKILRGCVQLLSEGKINALNVGNLVLIAKEAFHCLQKTKLHHHPVQLALEKLLYHITSHLLKTNFFADALTFAEYLKSELHLTVVENRDNEFNSICKQAHNQLWKSCISLQKSSKLSISKHELVLNARQLALSILLLTNHDRKWIVEAFVRTSIDFEQHVHKDPGRHTTLCSFFENVMSDLLSSEFKSRIKCCTEEDDFDRLICPVIEVTVQFTKCCILGKNHVSIIDSFELLSGILQNNKWSSDVLTSLTYLRTVVSLMRTLLEGSKTDERHSTSGTKKKGKKIQVPKCSLLNAFAKDSQSVKKAMEKGQYRIAPLSCLAEGLELFRKQQENFSKPSEYLSQPASTVLSTLHLYIDILTHMKQYYVACDEEDKGLNGKSVNQVYQRTLSRLLSSLNLMSSIHLQQLRELTNSVDTDLVSDASWVVHRMDEIVSGVSEGCGGALSVDEHRWLGNVSYNLGLVLYQKQIYDSAETLVVMSNNHLLQWCIQGESLLLNKTEKVNLWNKFELQLDCQRRQNSPDSALLTIATVLMYSIKDQQLGIQTSKWLEFWWKVKRDLAKKEEYEELRSRTILDVVKELDSNVLDDFTTQMSNLLEEELTLYEQQKHDTLQEEYAVVCDLLDIFQGDEYLAERALILIKLSHLLRTGRLESDNTPLECLDTSIALIQDELEQMDSTNCDKMKQLQDILAQANFWTYVCYFEENLSLNQNVVGRESQGISTSWNHLHPLQIALQLWESVFADSRNLALKNPGESLSCLSKISEIFGLQKLPLLQVRALTLTAHLSELIEDWQVAVLARCSLSGVMSTLGMLDEASVILYKCKQHVTNNSDDQLYLQCCLFKAQIFLYLVQDNRKEFKANLTKLLKLTSQMCHNYNRYFISAETKLLIARYIATSASEEDDKGLDIDGEMNLDLSPMQPAQEAMRLFTGVSKGVIGKDHDGTTELYGSKDTSYWLALQKVLESLLLVSELYTLQGCVREAKYYCQEGLNLSQMYNLPRWIATFNLSLCDSFNLQYLENSTLAAIKTIHCLLQDNEINAAKKNHVGDPAAQKSLSMEDSMDESFVLHTRMSSLDLSHESNLRSESLLDIPLDSPGFVSHAEDCVCNSCMDLELHNYWIHLFSVAAELVGVEHKQFDVYLSAGEVVWNWCLKQWTTHITNSIKPLNKLLHTSTNITKMSNLSVNAINGRFAKISKLRVIYHLHTQHFPDVPNSIQDGLNNLKFCQLHVDALSLKSEFMYLKALWNIYMLQSGAITSSLDQLISSCWSDTKGTVESMPGDITHQLGQLSIDGSEITKETTPAHWRDSLSGAYSRPELSRKEAVTKGKHSDDVSLDSLGLFSDIVDDNEEKLVKAGRTKNEKLTTAKKRKAVENKSKKGSLLNSSMSELATDVIAESVQLTDVFDFDEVSKEEMKPKRGRGRGKKQTSAPTVNKTSGSKKVKNTAVETTTEVNPALTKSRGRGKKQTSAPTVNKSSGSKKVKNTAVETTTEVNLTKSRVAKQSEVNGRKPITTEVKPALTKSRVVKQSEVKQSEEVKGRKPTRRRGRPAATEVVRNTSDEVDEQFNTSDESFRLIFDDHDDDEVDNESTSSNSYKLEPIVRLYCEDQETTATLNLLRQVPAECEEIELPRALSSEEEEELITRKRGRKTAAKRLGAKKIGNGHCRQKNTETSNWTAGDVIGIETAVKCLEEALVLLRKTAPNPMYRKICQLLALCLGEKQPQRTAEYLSQSMSVTLRHQKLTSLAKKLRKLQHLEEGKCLENESCKEHYKHQRLLTSSQLFSFSADLNSVKEVTSILPAGWTVCQLSVVNASPSSSGCLTCTSFVLLSRLERGQPPLVFHLPLVDSGPSKKSADSLMMEFNQVFQESKETVKNKDKQVWWASRQSLNDQLKDLMESYEQVFFGCWKVLLLGQVKEESLCEDICETARRFSNICASSFTTKEMNLKLCELIISGSSQLNRPELLQALAYLLGLCIGCSELAQALAIFQELTKGMSKNLKTTMRHPTGLILDKQLHHIAWESIPVLRAAPVFRIPSLHFLLSSLQACLDSKTVLGSGINTTDTSFVLNPSKDLLNTQKVFQDWFEKENRWHGVTGRVPSKEEYTTALTNQDLFIYCGHGNGREYFSGDEIQRLTCRAVTLLIGCSSGKLIVNGALDAAGMALSYIVAECPCIVANLWDVTDRDIDRFLEHLLKAWLDSGREQETLLDFMVDARNSCRLQYLIGSAPVMYGLPVHLKD